MGERNIIISGYTVIIDEDDFERVSKYKWHVRSSDKKKWGKIYFDYVDKTSGRSITFSLHRFIMGSIPNDHTIVDHINSNTLDNRKSNLRKCTAAENSRNRGLQKNNKSGIKGVRRVKNGKWIAQIKVNNQVIYLGSFDSPEKAKKNYELSSKQYHGEFGRTQ